MSVTGTIKQAFGSMRDKWLYGSTAPQGRVMVFSQQLDAFRRNLSDGLTLTRLRSLLQNADNGDLESGLTLFEEMEEKDPHLRTVAEMRRLSLTGLDWDIVSAAEDQEDGDDKILADEAAAFVKEQLSGLDTFDEAINELAMAIATNLSVVEMVWERSRLTELVPIPPSRLTMHSQTPGVVLVRTQEVPAGIPATPNKFVVYIPRGKPLFPFSRSLTRTQSFLFLTKILAMVDWATFATIFGMPVRIGTYEAAASDEDKQQLKDMLKNMGRSAWGAFSRAVNLEIKESSQRGTAPYEALCDYCDRKLSLLYLGGNLGTDTTGGTGTFAAASVQDQGKDDLRRDDIKKEAAMVRRQIISPMCNFHFGNRDVPLPCFKRVIPEPDNRVQDVQVIKEAQGVGLAIGKDWAYEKIDIPKPNKNDELLESMTDAFGAGVADGLTGGMGGN